MERFKKKLFINTFILLNVMLTNANDESSTWSKKISRPNEEILFGKLLNDIASQTRFTNIILIADGYYEIKESFHLHVLPS